MKVKTVLSRNLVDIPDLDRWRVPYLAKLLQERGQANYDCEDHGHLTVLIDSLCTN